MRLAFAGTPPFAAAALDALVDAGHQIVLVLTQPDRPAGRGMRLQASAVKQAALANRFEIVQPHGLRPGGRFADDADAAHARLHQLAPDAMVVAAYGLILPRTLLDIPAFGCINIHASLLPRWRGAAPIQRAIEAGDPETGITIMQMDEGLDTGPMLLARRIAIEPDDNAASLTDRLATLGGQAIVEALAAIAAGLARPEPQPASGAAVTYAAKLSREEGVLDLALPGRALVDRIRAFDPWPGCSARLIADTGGVDQTFKIWRAVVLPAADGTSAAPGTILGTIDLPQTRDPAILVATIDGAIALTELQKPGGKRSRAASFAHDFACGRCLRLVLAAAKPHADG